MRFLNVRDLLFKGGNSALPEDADVNRRIIRSIVIECLYRRSESCLFINGVVPVFAIDVDYAAGERRERGSTIERAAGSDHFNE